MLVTVAIIAMLASLALSAVGHGNDAARRVKCIAQMPSLGTALLLYTHALAETYDPTSNLNLWNPRWRTD